MRARSREWNGFRMTSIVGSVVLCALGHVYPITRAFICTRRRFRFARSIPHTRPDVIRIRIVSSSALRDAEYTAMAVGTTGPPPGNIPGRNKCGKSGVSYRPPRNLTTAAVPLIVPNLSKPRSAKNRALYFTLD